MLIAAHDLERRNQSLMPVLNLAQDSLDVVRYRKLAFGGVGDRNGVRRDRICKIGFGRDLRNQLEIESG